MNTNRRTFIAGAAAFAGMPTVVPSSALGKDGHVAPSNRIVVGGIGLGPRGRKVVDAFYGEKDCQFVAICDAQAERAEIIRRITNRTYKNEDCKIYREMEDILAREDIDAVLIATGDRWHTPASVKAVRAGKDVYCEKPCSMTIDESRELDEEVRKHKRIFQAGTQRRNVDNFAFASRLAQQGKLGKITSIHAGSIEPFMGHDPLPGEPLPDPEIIDWGRWLGPSLDMPYNKKYCQGRWRGHNNLSSGWKVLEWGSHTIDICQWAAGKDDTSPVEFEVDGSTIYSKYADGIRLVVRIAGFNGEGDWQKGLSSCPIRLEGEDGWVETGDSGLVVSSSESHWGNKAPEPMSGIVPTKHVRNFLDCVKSREAPACNSVIARNGHVTAHAASIAWRLGRKLTFDPKTERFVGDDEANALCKRERRKAYDI